MKRVINIEGRKVVTSEGGRIRNTAGICIGVAERATEQFPSQAFSFRVRGA